MQGASAARGLADGVCTIQRKEHGHLDARRLPQNTMQAADIADWSLAIGDAWQGTASS
jgi:hypothetical protein